MKALVGNWTPEWGHTWLTCGLEKIYALRSLAGGSYLCVFDAEGNALGEYPTPGEHSCHITLLERQAVVSDYTSGTLSLYPLGPDGIPSAAPALVRFCGHGPHPERQASSHIHSSWISPDWKHIVVVDLGCDRIYRYPVVDGKLVEDGLEAFDVPEGCGPRHCAFGKNRLYVATELSDEVLVLDWPSMELRQRILTNPEKPGGGGHIILKDGFLYVSSRLKNDGIAIFRVFGDGTLEKVGYCPTGLHPRHFCIKDNLLAVACRDSNLIQLFSMEAGSLKLLSETTSVSKPVYVELV